MSEPDYFKMAVDITELYIKGVQIGYSQGKIDGLAEGKKIVNKLIKESK
jgi:hypothetical protein